MHWQYTNSSSPLNKHVSQLDLKYLDMRFLALPPALPPVQSLSAAHGSEETSLHKKSNFSNLSCTIDTTMNKNCSTLNASNQFPEKETGNVKDILDYVDVNA